MVNIEKLNSDKRQILRGVLHICNTHEQESIESTRKCCELTKKNVNFIT